MIKPLPGYFHGLVLICWGWQTDMLVFALPMAVLLELKNHVNRRWVFSRQEFYLLADVTTAAIVGISIYYFTSVRTSHYLFFLLELSPIMFYPIVLALGYSTTKRLTADVFVYSLRKSRDLTSGEMEFEHLYAGLCLIAMGTNVESRSWFLVMAVILMGWMFWSSRPRRASAKIWIMLMIVALGSGLLLQQGLRESHLYVKKKSMQWLAGLIRERTDPFRSQTALGRVGVLKLSDDILFRVRVDTMTHLPLLRQEASYDTPVDNDWMVLNPGFNNLQQDDDLSWRWLESNSEESTLDVFYEFEDDKALLPMPATATGLSNLEAVSVSKSGFGSVKAVGITPHPLYTVTFQPGAQINKPPVDADIYLPGYYSDLMAKVIPGFDKTKAPIDQVRDYFADFRYSLYQPGSEFQQSPLTQFLLDSQAGHCEYFASATVMLLRALGVPARYVVGYSVQEYSSTSDMYLVRSRHAHAWAIAFVEGHWQVVDTTPSVWLETESARSSILQPLYDMASEVLFSARYWWMTRTELQKSLVLTLVAIVLGLVLIWRMMRSPQVRINNGDDVGSMQLDYPGTESPFYFIESVLTDGGRWRQLGESLSEWLKRIDHRELLDLLDLHYRWRFDPSGLSVDEEKEMVVQVDQWLLDRNKEAESIIS